MTYSLRKLIVLLILAVLPRAAVDAQERFSRRASYPVQNRQERQELPRLKSTEYLSVMSELDREIESAKKGPITEKPPWWTSFVTEPIEANSRPVQVNVGDLLLMAVEYSAKISVARTLPVIRETAVSSAEADFDWSNFVESSWNDTSDPIGSDLTVGTKSATRFRDHQFSLDAGFRRKLFNGAEIELSQELGHQDNNSSFFLPKDQATSRIVLGLTQPLLRGRGQVYNTSLITLAQLDTGSANDEFHRQLQSHLLEVARGYWALYLERANLAQKVSLYLKTKSIADQIKSRAQIDAQQSQVIMSTAALDSRKSDLVRARAAVKNAETRLRALLNAPDFIDGQALEMIPIEKPTSLHYPVNLVNEFNTAIQNRPEVSAALKSIRAASIRLRMANHEVLPSLNLVLQSYVAGLRGNSDYGNAWLDQVRRGEPSYTIGLSYEVPLGRRAAFANQRRRQVEVTQLQEQYRATVELVRADVEVAVRELQTAWRELHARNRSRKAAEADVAAQQARWKALGNHAGTGGLLLESLLSAQERLAQTEFDFAKSQLTYNLALINLKNANGTLFQIDQLSEAQTPPEPPKPVISR